MIHRWHAPHYERVPVYLWPWLFWQLWQIDRWTEYTGRQVFVEVDRQGRAYSTWWEGMDLIWDEETGESSRPWRMSDLQDMLPNSPIWRAASSGLGGEVPGALSPVHAQPAGLSRNLLSDAWTKSLARRKTQSLPNQLPGRAALARDERSSFRLILGLPPPVP